MIQECKYCGHKCRTEFLSDIPICYVCRKEQSQNKVKEDD